MSQTEHFINSISKWKRQSADLKTWAISPHRANQEHKKAVTTTGKGGYTVTVQNTYGEPPTSPEDHHEAIEDIQTIVQGM